MKKGFSLVELLIVAAVLGGIALFVMQLNKNATRAQVDASATTDLLDFRKEIDFLIENINDCSASLMDMVFRGSTIKNSPLQVELWSADQTGKRVRKRFSSSGPPFNKIGKVNVESIEFSMPDSNGLDFKEGLQTFKGVITIKSSLVKMAKSKKNTDIQKSIMLTFDTNAAGESTAKVCGAPGPSIHLPAISAEFSGVINSDSGDIKLPVGKLKMTLVATYNYCADMRALLYFDGVKVGEAIGDGIESEGCSENVIMASTEVDSNGGPYSVKLVSTNNKGPNVIQWFVIPN